jgi:hypothetical protein
MPRQFQCFYFFLLPPLFHAQSIPRLPEPAARVQGRPATAHALVLHAVDHFARRGRLLSFASCTKTRVLSTLAL